MGTRPGRVGAADGVECAAGHGKSALLAAAAEDASHAGLQVLRARCGQMETEIAFGTIRQLFEKPVAELSETERDRLYAGAAAPAGRVMETVTGDRIEAAASARCTASIGSQAMWRECGPPF